VDVDLQRARDEIARATSGLTAENLVHPAQGKWTIAEILEHLTLTFRLNARAMEKVASSGEPRARRPTLFERTLRTVVIEAGYFPRAPAPERVRPTGSIPAERSREALDEALVALSEALEKATARFGDDLPLVDHTYFGGLTVRQWRKFHRRHVHHHMRQVRQRMRR
jgi:hypothetical protein